MAVEVKVGGESKIKEWNFPCLAISSLGDVVLFTGQRNGTCLTAVHHLRHVGETGITWAMHEFTPLSPSESITLRNI